MRRTSHGSVAGALGQAEDGESGWASFHRPARPMYPPQFGAASRTATAPASTQTTPMTVVRRGSSTSSSISDGSDAETTAAPSRLGSRSRHSSHVRALRSAAQLQSEIFPHGVASQGVMKRGQQWIAADVKFSSAGSKDVWHGFIIDDVLYMYVSGVFGGCDFRTAVTALVELAEDTLGCFSVLVALPKALETPPRSVDPVASAATMVRAFMYSGFELVSPLLYQPSDAYILVGYDAM
ncbi:hypothetical protein GGI23_001853 [Coemansia sp. RSA 2559]|nr:hypothetical protein GGI23_001853 [Coemansia sp. RSA 2559]KAJ2856791.1 hypothetical protein GGI22_003701 [Coemansia erecta]